jgi:hypothetical protein
MLDRTAGRASTNTSTNHPTRYQQSVIEYLHPASPSRRRRDNSDVTKRSRLPSVPNQKKISAFVVS